ncbi:sensor protein [Vibrio sp. ZSDE26]|uniref:Sensor protein n=1 Tax=Vibrio amylolyticus TaxID=2847292 RepID=A0A9X1XN03_9VIBR|nr:sensor protein [Vibrio amylolyticus]MCK6263950.1 sensor protein [Vibrio amylolyticus]
MKNCFVFLLLFLSGCAAKHMPYSAKLELSGEAAVKIIEQVVMEQPLNYRPEDIVVTDSYIGLSDGLKTSSHTMSNINEDSGMVLSSLKIEASDISSRYYFNSISALELFSKSDWYIVQMKNDENLVVKLFYTRSLSKAERLIDAISYMIISAKPFGS